ncbi:MAG: hypothetical protein ACYDBQ_11675 [Thermoplasmatota archaeon]
MRATILALALLLAFPLAAADDGGPGSANPSDRPTPSRDASGPDGGASGGGQGSGDGGGDHGAGSADDGPSIEDRGRSFDTVPAANGPALFFNATEGLGRVHEGNVSALTAAVASVSEFVDANGNGRFDLGEPVLQRVTLASANASVVQVDNATRDARYQLPRGGTVTLVFHLKPEDAGAASKFDILIDDFPFQSTATRIAVVVLVHVDGGVRFATLGGEPALAGLDAKAPFLSWTRQATVDGLPADVGATIQVAADQNSADGILAWSYPQGRHIVHDPKLGVATFPSVVLGSAPAFLLATAAGVALLATGFALRRRSAP